MVYDPSGGCDSRLKTTALDGMCCFFIFVACITVDCECMFYRSLQFSGLNKVHIMTSSGQCRLRVEISSWDGDSAWAEYRLVALFWLFLLFVFSKSISLLTLQYVFGEREYNVNNFIKLCSLW